jgi:hypothetical protein
MSDPDAVSRHFSASRELLERVAGDRDLLAAIGGIADRIAQALRAGGSC